MIAGGIDVRIAKYDKRADRGTVDQSQRGFENSDTGALGPD
jgi:hypothetical protein